MEVTDIRNLGWYGQEAMLFTGTPSTGTHYFRAIVLAGNLKELKMTMPDGGTTAL